MERLTTVGKDKAFGEEFLPAILEFMADNFEPEDIFSVEVLETWAYGSLGARYLVEEEKEG